MDWKILVIGSKITLNLIINFIKNIDHIQIQFHNYIEGSKKLRNQIRKELKKSHKCKFNFPFIWERWDRIT
jgi:hypothetical protein